MSQKVYLETSVVSYLTARLSRDLIVAGHQQMTQEWWANHRHKFELFVRRRRWKKLPREIRKPSSSA